MFKHMSDARFAHDLISAADFIKDIGGDYVCIIVHRDYDYLQAVF